MQATAPRRQALPAALFLTVAALAGCASGGSSVDSGAVSVTASAVASTSAMPTGSAKPPVPRSAQPASALLDSSISAMKAQKSVHIDCTLYGAGDSTESEDIGVTSGRSVSTSGSVSITAMLVNKVVYVVTGTAGVLVASGIPQAEAANLAGKWISIKPGDSYGKGPLNYVMGVRGMTIARQAEGLRLAAPVTRTESRTIQGQPVYGVSGGASTYYGGTAKSAVVTVYVAASGAPLPAAVSVHANSGVTTCNFSKWNEPLNLTAPANAVPLASIPAN